MDEVTIHQSGKSGRRLFYDSVYGHILVSELAREIIDTKEFQRLRRIKQLAMGSIVFPCAEHTRFTHSLGTYYVMTRIVEQLRRHLEQQDPKQSPEQRELKYEALTIAALVHDLGHGPFSHSFEQFLQSNCPVGGEGAVHERWTQAILEDPETDIHKKLNAYDRQKGREEETFCKEVLRFLSHDPSGSEDPADELEQAFASLVSSSLDADRLDYMQRDTLFTGAVYGGFDMDSIIDGLRVVHQADGKLCVAVQAEKQANLEGFFFLRQQMYSNVYYNSQKVFAETLLTKIFAYAKELYYREILASSDIVPSVRRLFECSALTVEEYCQLDDYVIIGTIRNWGTLQKAGTRTLATMCTLFLERRGYEPIPCDDAAEWEKVIREHLSEREIGAAAGTVCELPFWVTEKKEEKPYSQIEAKLVFADGRLAALMEESPLLKACRDMEIKNEIAYWSADVCREFLNELLFESDPQKAKDTFESIEALMKSPAREKEAVSESKYVLKDNATLKECLKQTEQCLNKRSYTPAGSGQFMLTDYYFDTTDRLLYKNDCTIRLRCKRDTGSKGSKKPKETWVLTVKKPQNAPMRDSDAVIVERNRFEKSIPAPKQAVGTACLTQNAGAIAEYLGTVFSPDGTSQWQMPELDEQPFAEITTQRWECKYTRPDTKETFIIHADISDGPKDGPEKLYLLELEYRTDSYDRLSFFTVVEDLKQEGDSALSAAKTARNKLQWYLQQS